MVRASALILAAMLCACSAEQDEPEFEEISPVESPEPLPSEAVDSTENEDAYETIKPQSKDDDILPMDDLTIDNTYIESEPIDYCWADYCPCDTEDPDYGYIDVSICRDLRMGVHVSDDQFSIGARNRDARRAIREFREDN